MIWPIVRFSIAAPALVLIALQQSDTWKDPNTFWQAVPFLAVALAGTFEPLVAGIREHVSARRIEREVTCREILGVMVARVEELTAIMCADLGASVYKLRWWRPGRRRLRRVARLRLAPQPASNVSWCIGKGVVGLCAQSQTDVAKDVYRLHDPIRTSEEWSQLPLDITLGLDWEECESLRGKHGHVLGTPINHPRTGKTIGVVTLDGPPEESSVLDANETRQILREAATECAREI